ncbi:MAG: hexose kinase [Candidatus Omnitrophota bacterium]
MKWLNSYMPAPVLTVTLNPAVDKTIKGPRVKLSAGGKGINVSRALKAMGVRSIATGLAAGASGKFILSELKKEGIKGRFSQVKGLTRTNLTVIDARGRIIRGIQDGPAVARKEFSGFKKKFTALLKGRCYAVFSGANANGLGPSAYAELIGISRKAGVVTVLDTRGEALKRGLRARPDIAKPNAEEAEYICGISPRTRGDIRKIMRVFHRKGARTVLLTLGAKGAAASDGERMVFARPPKILTGNSVGCGDAFLAGFIARRLEGGDLASCLRAATAAGTANAAGMVPGAFKKKDYKWIYSATTLT